MATNVGWRNYGTTVRTAQETRRKQSARLGLGFFGKEGCLHAVADVELVENVRHVVLHGLLAEEQFVSDLLVGFPLSDQFKYLLISPKYFLKNELTIFQIHLIFLTNYQFEYYLYMLYMKYRLNVLQL